MRGRRVDLAVVGVAVVAAVVTLLGTWHGLNVTPDGYSYAGSALAAADGDGFVHPPGDHRPSVEPGDPVTLFPLGYPAILAAGSELGDVFTVARLLNVVLAAALVVLTALLASRLGADRQRTLIAAGLAAVLPGINLVNISLLSEPLFTLLALAGVLLLTYDQMWLGRIALAGGFVGAACLIRYAGVALLLGGCLWLLLRERTWSRRLASVSVFGVVGIIPLTILLLRNEDVSGTLTGPRPESTNSPLTVANDFVESWGFLVLRHATQIHVVVGAVVVALLLLACRPLLDLRPNDRRQADLLGVLIVVVVYLAYLVVAQFQVAFDPFNARFLFPVVPLVVALWVVVDRGRWFRPAAVGLIAVGSIISLRAAGSNVLNDHRDVAEARSQLEASS